MRSFNLIGELFVCKRMGREIVKSGTNCRLRETTQSNLPDSSTNLKSGQKSFSPCQGARLLPCN
ncbi:unknown protein [Microcystis aeruginosa NIES-843]|uniref:Uncharacterized protein n=1 Tax=Microcystis aeruginosa (strain NIES-843 / IAM M-2473) TaxID=449447 RepID=B0JFS0_MICAN|nr:unknown protein [Microcystis aeruginosa NIES-843]